MQSKKSFVALSVAAALSLSACMDESDDGGKQTNNKSLTGNTVTLTNDNIYLLAPGFPGTYIGNGEAADGDSSNDDNMNLEIEAGTLILGNSQEALIVTRGSKIEAKGTAADPIVMTSSKQFNAWKNGGDGTSGRGEWAGFALMGYAKTNECGDPCDVVAEGNIGSYGGKDDNDGNGTVEYVVVRHAGNDLDGNGNELNGFTLFGVGSETKMNHIQVHKGFDDGVEHFGSSDFMSYIVLTDNADDSFDWGQGYTGGAQFVVIKQANDDADRAIEADNDKNSPNGAPISQPTLANMTLIGPSEPAADASGADGILLRRGTGANIYNSVITGFPDACIDIDETATMDRAYDGTNYTGDLSIANSFVDCATDFESGDQDLTGDDVKETFADVGKKMVSEWFAESGTGNDSTSTVDISAAGIPQNSFASAVTGLNFDATGKAGFVDTTYAGAFDPAGSNWTEGWTVGLNGNKTVWQPASSGTLNGATPAGDGECPAGTTFVETITLSAEMGNGTMDLCQMERRYDSSDVEQ